MNKKITVKDLRDLKGKKKLVSILVKNVDEAKAAHKVGFEMLATGSPGVYLNPDNHPGFEEIIEIRKTVVKGAKYEFRTVNLCFVILSSNKRFVILIYLLVSSVSFFNNLIKNTLSKTLCTSLLDS